MDDAGARVASYKEKKAQLEQTETQLESQQDQMNTYRQQVAEMTQWMPKAKAYGATQREVKRLTEKFNEATAEWKPVSYTHLTLPTKA